MTHVLTAPIERLVANKDICKKLVDLGIEKQAVFFWRTDPDFGKDYLLINTLPNENDIPAWTYEEIRIMLGNHVNGADLPEPRPRAMEGEEITFYINFPDVQKSYKQGAQANAEILEFLLNKKQLKPEDANRRYRESFNPE